MCVSLHASVVLCVCVRAVSRSSLCLLKVENNKCFQTQAGETLVNIKLPLRVGGKEGVC